MKTLKNEIPYNISDFKQKIRKGYGVILSRKQLYKRSILARILGHIFCHLSGPYLLLVRENNPQCVLSACEIPAKPSSLAKKSADITMLWSR
jgi:hypothetical protein